MPLTKRTVTPPTPAKNIPPKKTTQVKRAPVEEVEEEAAEETVSTPTELIDSIIDGAKEFSNPEPGTYVAIVYEIKLNEPGDKGQSIQIEYVLYVGDREEEMVIRRFSRWFKMLDEDLTTPNEWGPVFYNRTMAKLGYEKGNRGHAARNEITSNKPAVSLKIKANSKNSDFVDADIVGLLDDENEEVQLIREEIVNNPW